MTINTPTLRKLEHTYRRSFTADLRKYLLMKYAQEPFPYEFTEQDLHESIRRDIRDYDAGKLDVTVKSPSERWSEEREYLQELYFEKSREVHDLKDYIAELEHMLSAHGLESSRMAERRGIQF